MTLDSSGRFHLQATQPGLIDVRVIATDTDGHTRTLDKQLRIKDPSDTSAPALAWAGVLQGATLDGRPLDITSPAALQASLDEQQAMGYRLQTAPAGSDQWQTLAEQSLDAATIDQQLALASLDPAAFANGVYQLRLTAWDLAGRTSEIDARVIIDTAQKTTPTATAVDAIMSLIATAKANGLEPRAWLTDVPTRLPTTATSTACCRWHKSIEVG